MSVLYIMLPAALALMVVAILAFIRSARAGHYDDLDTPALRMLVDEDDPWPRSPVPAQRASAVRTSPPRL